MDLTSSEVACSIGTIRVVINVVVAAGDSLENFASYSHEDIEVVETVRVELYPPSLDNDNPFVTAPLACSRTP